MRVQPAGAALLLAVAAIATLHAPRAGGDAIELGRWGARGAVLAWVYHEGRIFRQTVDEDPLLVDRLPPDGAPARGGAGDSSVATAEECLQDNSRIRLVVDRDEVIYILTIVPFSPASSTPVHGSGRPAGGGSSPTRSLCPNVAGPFACACSLPLPPSFPPFPLPLARSPLPRDGPRRANGAETMTDSTLTLTKPPHGPLHSD